MPTIRNARLADAPIIADHNCRLAWESESQRLDPAQALAGVEAAIADPLRKGPYYLACEGTEIVGQCQVTFEWSDWRNGWFWWVQSVYVHPEHRRRGILRQLYEHVREAARQAGDVIALRLYVERDNRTARAAYENLGLHAEHYDFMSNPIEKTSS